MEVFLEQVVSQDGQETSADVFEARPEGAIELPSLGSPRGKGGIACLGLMACAVMDLLSQPNTIPIEVALLVG